MANKESTFKNMALSLFAVTCIASTSLALVYKITTGPKAEADLFKKNTAIREVVPGFNNNPIEEKYSISSDIGPLWCYPAKKDGKPVATAVESLTKIGFAGQIKVLVGILPDGKIYDTAVLQHNETPGLGNKIEKSKSRFTEQFKGINPGSFNISVKKDGGDVDAITAATISSRAYCDAVRRAYDSYVKAGSR